MDNTKRAFALTVMIFIVLLLLVGNNLRELQKSVAVLSDKIDRLSSHIDSLEGKIEDFEIRISINKRQIENLEHTCNAVLAEFGGLMKVIEDGWSIIQTYNPHVSADQVIEYSLINYCYAKKYNFKPELGLHVMGIEHGYQHGRNGSCGERGPGHHMPATANWIASRLGRTDFDFYTDMWDLHTGIEFTYFYLDYQRQLWGADLSLIIAGYNAGQGNVRKYGGVPPFECTQWYVQKINERVVSL